MSSPIGQPVQSDRLLIRSTLAKMPPWLKRSIGKASELQDVQKVIKQRQIHTICEEGRCPNRAECYRQKTATFLLMGPTCTRACAFCQVDKGHAPMPLDPGEPHKVAEAVQILGLRYVVLTAVARDDLPDGGAGWFVQTMNSIRELNLDTPQIEVLTPDFYSRPHYKTQGGNKDDQNDCSEGSRTIGRQEELVARSRDLSRPVIDWQRERIRLIVEAKPACYNHNIETVRRLQGPVRRGAQYDRSLDVLRFVKEFDPSIPTKSGLMLGHGETEAEVIQTMQDLRSVGCDRLTMGQYMQPSLEHLPVQKYWTPEEFDELGAIALGLGFQQVRSGPLVRSSYHAGEA